MTLFVIESIVSLLSHGLLSASLAMNAGKASLGLGVPPEPIFAYCLSSLVPTSLPPREMLRKVKVRGGCGSVSLHGAYSMDAKAVLLSACEDRKSIVAGGEDKSNGSKI